MVDAVSKLEAFSSINEVKAPEHSGHEFGISKHTIAVTILLFPKYA